MTIAYYRVVIHGIASRDLARELAAQLAPGAEAAGLSAGIVLGWDQRGWVDRHAAA